MSKKPTAEELLEGDEYEKVQELDHEEIAEFVMKSLQYQNFFTVAFKLSMVSISAIVLAQVIIHWEGGESFLGLLAGVLITFTAGVLIHEILHLIAYFLLGARKLSIVPKWSQGAVVAAADQFVIGRRGFYFLAMTPFVLLTAGAFVALFYTHGIYYHMVLSFLFFHSMACIGDFGMASYFYENRDRTIYTFDDMENEKSYFFELKQEI